MFSSDLSSRKTRISAHFLDAAPAEGDVVTVEGWVTYYDEAEKSWKPLENAEVRFYLDGRELGETKTNSYGMYSFSFLAPHLGKHKVEVRVRKKPGYEASSKTIEFQVLKGEEKRRIGKLARDILILIIALIFLLFLALFITRFRV